MELTGNKVKTDKDGKPIKQTLVYEDPYTKLQATYFNRSGQTILGDLETKKKR